MLRPLMILSLAVAGVTMTASPSYAQENSGYNAAPVMTEEAMTERVEIAREILKLQPIERDVDVAIDKIAERVPADKRVLFRSIIDRSLKVDRLYTAAELAYAELFTKAELEMMRKYYESPEGQSIIRDKLPKFQERINPIVKEMIQNAFRDIQRQNIMINPN